MPGEVAAGTAYAIEVDQFPGGDHYGPYDDGAGHILHGSDNWTTGMVCYTGSTQFHGLDGTQRCATYAPGAVAVLTSGFVIQDPGTTFHLTYQLQSYEDAADAWVYAYRVLYWGSGYEMTATPTASVTPWQSATPVACDWVSWFVYPVDWAPIVNGARSAVMVVAPIGSTAAQVKFAEAVTLTDGGSTWTCVAGGWCDVPIPSAEIYCYGSASACIVQEGRSKPGYCVGITPMPTFSAYNSGSGIILEELERGCPISAGVDSDPGGFADFALQASGIQMPPEGIHFGFRLCFEPKKIVAMKMGSMDMLPYVTLLLGFSGMLIVVWYTRRS
jgi:hypothetical protein